MPQPDLSQSQSSAPTASVWLAFNATLKRELLMAYRRLGDFVNPLAFCVIVATLFPLGVGPNPSTLALIAPGVIWVIALLASMLSSDILFRSDFDDGSLEQMLLSPVSMYFQMLAKSLAHWLLTGLPLTILSPIIGIMLSLPEQALTTMMLSMLLGTVTLSMFGAIGSALTVSLRKGGLLIAVITLPLYVPVLIFGVGAVQSATVGASPAGELAFLAAMLALTLCLAPLAIAAAVKISIDN